MKKNLVLFFIAVGLATFTYFFQELKDRKEFEEAQNKGILLDPAQLGQLKGFQLPKVTLTKQGEQYLLDSGEMADERKVNWFMEILSGIRMRRALPDKDWTPAKHSQFFPNDEEKIEFVFEKGRVSFLLGKKLDFDQSFYMEVFDGKKLTRVVAFDAGEMETIYDKKDGHRSDHRYRRFQALFYLTPEFFKDYRLFRHWMTKKWSLLEVTIDNKGNRKYSLNFPEAKTIPAIPFFLKRDEKMMKDFEANLIKLEGKKYTEKAKKLSEESILSEMTVNSTQGEARLKLFKDSETKKYIVHSSLDDRAYEIDDKHAQSFLRPVQDFWNLVPFTETPAQMSFFFPNDKNYQLSFKKEDGRFTAQSAKGEAIHQSFAKLLRFIKTPARYWVAGEAYEEAFIEQFAFDWGLGPFFLMIRSGEVLLYHKEKKQGLIYPIEGSPPFPMVKDQYIHE